VINVFPDRAYIPAAAACDSRKYCTASRLAHPAARGAVLVESRVASIVALVIVAGSTPGTTG
jgi:hypothetical protein